MIPGVRGDAAEGCGGRATGRHARAADGDADRGAGLLAVRGSPGSPGLPGFPGLTGYGACGALLRNAPVHLTGENFAGRADHAPPLGRSAGGPRPRPPRT
ncbi:hypothetical protein [Streptomyces sp. YIM S03343]